MADINFSRQNYNTAAAPQLNGWKPNTNSGALGTNMTAISAGGSAEIPADFKDHKTVFLVNAAAAANVTISAGTSGAAAKDLLMEVPAGYSLFWLDSAPFVDKATGKISISSDKAISIIGYEMR